MSHSCYSMVLIMGTNEFNNLKTLITVTQFALNCIMFGGI